MPNCRAGSAGTLCTVLLHRNCGVALGVWMLFMVSSTALPSRCNESQIAGTSLVAKLALDSICQKLSMHVTRTKVLLLLMIGGLTERLATPDDVICEHLKGGLRSPQKCCTEPHSCRPSCAYHSVALRRKPPNKHSSLLLLKNFRGTAHRVAAMHTRCTSNTLCLDVLAADVAPHTRGALLDARDKKTTIFTDATYTWLSQNRILDVFLESRQGA
jgi:hypothetical protein